jgi:hypothetical protein
MTVTKTHVIAGIGSGVLVGALVFGALGVSAHSGTNGSRSPVISELLGLEQEEFREMKQSGQTMEEIAKSQGFADLDEFTGAVEAQVRSNLSERGFTETEIEERMTEVRDRHQIREEIREVRERLLGMTHEEFRAALESGQSRDKLYQSAGYEDADALHAAVAAELQTLWESAGVDQATIDQRLERLEHRGQHMKAQLRQGGGQR